jgi:hypothetical protein
MEANNRGLTSTAADKIDEVASNRELNTITIIDNSEVNNAMNATLNSTNLTVIGNEQANQSLRELKANHYMQRQYDIARLENNNNNDTILADAIYFEYEAELNSTEYDDYWDNEDHWNEQNNSHECPKGVDHCECYYDYPEGFDECECCANNKYERFDFIKSGKSIDKCHNCDHYRDEHDKNYY